MESSQITAEVIHSNAALRAFRINLEQAKLEVLESSSSRIDFEGHQRISESYKTRIDINDLPAKALLAIQKTKTLDDIKQCSDVLEIYLTRGNTPAQTSVKLDKLQNNCTEESPLYLCLYGPNKPSIMLAIELIEELVNSAMSEKNDAPMCVEKVLIGMEDAPPSFDLIGRVCGEGGAHLQYISGETGAEVTLRGQGSGFLEPGINHESPEPLHIRIEHKESKMLDAAQLLARHLLGTTQEDLKTFQLQQEILAQQVSSQPVTYLRVPPPSLPGLDVRVPPPSLSEVDLRVPPPSFPGLDVRVPPPLPYLHCTPAVLASPASSTGMDTLEGSAPKRPRLNEGGGGIKLSEKYKYNIKVSQGPGNQAMANNPSKKEKTKKKQKGNDPPNPLKTVLGTWNVQGCSSSEARLQVDRDMINASVLRADGTPQSVVIACLQETHLTTGVVETPNYIWHCSGGLLPETSRGVAIVLHKSANITLHRFLPVSDSVCLAQVEAHSVAFSIISCHLPVPSDTSHSRIAAEIDAQIATVPQPVVVAGCFNARIGRLDELIVTATQSNKPVYDTTTPLTGRNLLHDTTDENGRFLKLLATKYKLSIRNTFAKPSALRFSWTDGTTQAQLDYILASYDYDVRIRGDCHHAWFGLENKSNHKLITISLRLKHPNQCQPAVSGNSLQQVSQKKIFKISQTPEKGLGLPKFDLTFELITWNVMGCVTPKDREDIESDLLGYKIPIDIVALQETHLPSGQLETSSYSWFCSGGVENNRRGVAILLRKGSHFEKSKFTPISGCLCSVQLYCEGIILTVICCYLPAEPGRENEEVRKDLSLVLLETSGRTVLLGDFNVRIIKRNVRKKDIKKLPTFEHANENGIFLTTLIEKNKLGFKRPGPGVSGASGKALAKMKTSTSHIMVSGPGLVIQFKAQMIFGTVKRSNFKMMHDRIYIRKVTPQDQVQCEEGEEMDMTPVGQPKPEHPLELICWNVMGCAKFNQRQVVETDLLSQGDIDIVAIQTTGIPTNQFESLNFSWFCSGGGIDNRPKGFPKSRGVAILLRKNKCVQMKNFSPISDYLCTANIHWSGSQGAAGKDLTMVCCLLPKYSDPDNIKVRADLSQILLDIKGPTVLLGTFNAHIGHKYLTNNDRIRIGKMLRHLVSNENGVFLKALAEKHDLCFANTFTSRIELRTTRVSSKNKMHRSQMNLRNEEGSQIDHILISKSEDLFGCSPRAYFATHKYSEHKILRILLKSQKSNF